MKKPNLVAILEALLFVTATPQSVSELAAASESAEEDVAAALDRLRQQLQSRGIRLANAQGGYQLITAPQLAPQVEHFLGSQAKVELSKPVLETLAIVVYRQPVTKSQIEEIRGVASDQSIKSLLARELIVETGLADLPGRPTLYRPSHRLLHHLGLTSFDELARIDEVGSEDDAH